MSGWTAHQEAAPIAVGTAPSTRRRPESLCAPETTSAAPEVRVVDPADRTWYERHHAAMHGDRSAFSELCEELTEALTRVVGQLLSEEGRVFPGCERQVVDHVFAVAFEELAEKPTDWSTYGWMRWLAVREITSGDAWRRDNFARMERSQQEFDVMRSACDTRRENSPRE